MKFLNFCFNLSCSFFCSFFNKKFTTIITKKKSQKLTKKKKEIIVIIKLISAKFIKIVYFENIIAKVKSFKILYFIVYLII